MSPISPAHAARLERRALVRYIAADADAPNRGSLPEELDALQRLVGPEEGLRAVDASWFEAEGEPTPHEPGYARVI